MSNTIYIPDEARSWPAWEVLLNGSVREDYIPIKDGYGKEGRFFPSMTDEERNNITIRRKEL